MNDFQMVASFGIKMFHGLINISNIYIKIKKSDETKTFHIDMLLILRIFETIRVYVLRVLIGVA